MSNVIELEDYRRVWVAGKALCKNCNKEHIGVFHKDKQKDTECPYCYEMKADVVEVIDG